MSKETDDLRARNKQLRDEVRTLTRKVREMEREPIEWRDATRKSLLTGYVRCDLMAGGLSEDDLRGIFRQAGVRDADTMADGLDRMRPRQAHRILKEMWDLAASRKRSPIRSGTEAEELAEILS